MPIGIGNGRSGEQGLGATQPRCRPLGESPIPKISTGVQAVHFSNADVEILADAKTNYEKREIPRNTTKGGVFHASLTEMYSKIYG